MSALIPEGMEPLAVCWMCRLNLPHRVPGQCSPDQSAGWLRWLDGMSPEEWAARIAAEPVVARPVVEPMDDGVPPGYFRPVGEPFTARKLSAVIEVPDELLMDYGVIPDTRPKPPPPTWRTRFRRKRAEWRDRAARRAYKLIAGDWPDDGTDWRP